MTSPPPKKTYKQKKIGDYLLDKPLGAGSFGEVRLGIHLPTGEKVAVKVLEKSKITCETDFQRILREIQVLKLLDHPNVVRLLEVIDTNNNIYIVTELAEGGELFEHVSRIGRLPEASACDFFRQICLAVQYCHTRSVIHRDIKLENVLLDKSLNAKVADFGLARVFEDNTKLMTACGSSQYAAPEILNQRGYGAEADVWSLGILLFAMVAGYLPFDDPDVPKLFRKITAGQFSTPHTMSPGLVQLLHKMLDVDPRRRLTLQQVMTSAWYVEASTTPIVEPTQQLSREIDFKVVHSMAGLEPGWTSKAVVESLLQNKHNQLTATYLLLAEKFKRPLDEDEQMVYARAVGYEVRHGEVLPRDAFVEVEFLEVFPLGERNKALQVKLAVKPKEEKKKDDDKKDEKQDKKDSDKKDDDKDNDKDGDKGGGKGWDEKKEK